MANNITIQRGVPIDITLSITDDTTTPVSILNLTGKTVFISVKDLSDNADNDNGAFITDKITVHSAPLLGQTEWSLTATDTLIPIGRYKADIRVYTAAGVYINTDIFNIEVVDIVTKRII
jgi:hypothetical protein